MTLTPLLLAFQTALLVPADDGQPSKAELAEKIRVVLEGQSKLRLTAHVSRVWRTRDGQAGQRRYRAEILMQGDEVRGQVFDAVTGIEAARSFGKGDSEEITPVGEKEPDACLFGTLNRSWIGPMAADSTFVRRLAKPDCKLLGIEQVGDRYCYKLVHNYQVFDEGDRSEWVEQTLYIDRQTSLPLRWFSESREGKTWSDGHWFMNVDRVYQYDEPKVQWSVSNGQNRTTVHDGGGHSPGDNGGGRR